jgi:ArsR family transcriptional regulator
MTAMTVNVDSAIAHHFQILADPIRLATVELLQERELCVCELCDLLEIAQSKLSFHLKKLREAGFVIARQEGRWTYYRLNLVPFVELEQYLAQFRLVSQLLPAPRCLPSETATSATPDAAANLYQPS